MTLDEVARAVYAAGFRGTQLVEMTAIVMRESSGNPRAFNGNTGTGDQSYGLTQINMIGSLGPSRDALFKQIPGYVDKTSLWDPAVNLRAAYLLSKNGTDLSPWGAYKGVANTHNTNLAAAQSAVAGLTASGQISVPPSGFGASATGNAGSGGGLTAANVAAAAVLGPLSLFGNNSLPSIPNPLSGIDAVGHFFSSLLNPTFWKRIGIGLGGLALLGIGAALFMDIKPKDIVDAIPAAAAGA